MNCPAGQYTQQTAATTSMSCVVCTGQALLSLFFLGMFDVVGVLLSCAQWDTSVLEVQTVTYARTQTKRSGSMKKNTRATIV